MEILSIILLVVLGCLFPALLIDAIQETEEKAIPDRRYRACACFSGILFLLVLILN